MKIEAKRGEVLEEVCDVLVVGLFSGQKNFGGMIAMLDRASDGLISRVIKEEGFVADASKTLLVRTDGRLKAKRVMLVGLGLSDRFTLETVRCAAASAVIVIRQMNVRKLSFTLVSSGKGDVDAHGCSQALTEGALLGAYSFGRYKKEDGKTPKTMMILAHDRQTLRHVQKGIEDGIRTSTAVIFARDLVNTPAQHMRPADLVDAARAIVKGKGRLRVKVYDKSQLERMGAGGILAVAQGSDHQPYLVHLIYRPSGKPKKRVAVVGKAVTFDSGGLSLKPADSMTTMKCDMAGGAAVLGLFNVMNELSPKVEVHGIFAAVENMPSGSAIRPGDVVRIMNKKTIEILNTDAEGRVTLADSLSYAAKLKPDVIVDLATLTGACVVALGEEITGVMSNDPKLAQAILASASVVGEKMWELPLEENYKTLISSDVADYKNIAGKWGGALTAGLLLREFVGDISWAHLDIAGPSFAERQMTPYMRKGATGHGVRTLIQWLKSF